MEFNISIENRRHMLFMNKINRFDTNKCVQLENDNVEWKEVRIDELFELVRKSGPKYDVRESSSVMTRTKQIPYYSMLGHDNGLKGYVEKASIEDDGFYIIVGNYGSSNTTYCSYCIKPKKEWKDKLGEDVLSNIAFLIGQAFVKKYTYSNSLNLNRLMNETVILPFDKLSDEILNVTKICCLHANDKFSKFNDVMMRMNDMLNELEEMNCIKHVK